MTEQPAVEAPQLRPLGVGDIIDRVIRMYRAKPLLFLTLAAIPGLVTVLIEQGARLLFPDAFFNFDQFTFLNDPTKTLNAFQAEAGRARFGDTIVALISLIPQVVSIGALTYAPANLYLGRPVTISGALRAAIADVPRLLLTLFVVSVFAIVLWSLAIVVTIIPIAVTGIGVLGVLLFISILIVPFFLLASLALTPTISALEDAGPIASIRRSLGLVKGARWRILGVIVLLFVLEFVFSVILSAIFLAAFVSNSTAGRVMTVLVSAAGTIIWEPLPWGALALFYYDLRVRKEAFDLQLAVETLPRAD